MKYLVLLVALLALYSCQNVETSTSDKKCDNFDLRRVVFDSIQVFVDLNRNLNFNSRIYLLEFREFRGDSICFVLTTIKETLIPDKYASCPYYYNKDSSLLIIRIAGNLLFENHHFENELRNVVSLNFTQDTVAYIYNPLVWELVLTKENVYLDRFYGVREAEEKLIVPKSKFMR